MSEPSTSHNAQLGMVGLGRMGANMVHRLQDAGIQCAGFDFSSEAVAAAVATGATGTSSLAQLVESLASPRAVWIMVPAAFVDSTIADLVPLLSEGDIVIDGGNSHYHDDIRRSEELAAKGIHYLDVGTSGGVFGLERGYCMMVGGDDESVTSLTPVFDALSPGPGDIERTPGLTGPLTPAEQGWLHCGPAGAGHFVKMVHNGIEYGMMAAYAEGLNILHHADVGKAEQTHDAETSPLERPELYRYDLDLGAITEVWRRGSVVASWLLDLTAAAYVDDPALAQFHGRVADSGEGRWTLQAAIDVGAPTPVLASALFSRFSSRGEGDYGNKLLSAMRKQFGGHAEQQIAADQGADTQNTNAS